jgi:antitoxin component YwqK of YwqJK toxin-antitoxin module
MNSIYYPKLQKEEEEEVEEEVQVKFSNLNELSKKRLALLGYSIFQKCSLGQPVSSDELENRIQTIRHRYPSLTEEQLVETCKLSESEEKERKTGEKYKPYRIYETEPETLHGIDVLTETTDIPEDVLSNILMEYGLLNLKEVTKTSPLQKEIYTVSENGKKYGPYKKYYRIGWRTVPWIEANYWNDQLDGEYKNYYKQEGQNPANLKYQANYKNGKLDGEYKGFLESGKLVSHKIYKDGKVIQDLL